MKRWRQRLIDLGVEPDHVRAELYKVLLYEPGSFFKKHRDTEKADGMFGTLVVQLPSRYIGENKRDQPGKWGDGSFSMLLCRLLR